MKGIQSFINGKSEVFKMKAIVLIDNITKNELLAEWGLAVHIEHNGHQILLDAGTTGAFAENAKSLGIDLTQVEKGVLSHAHYDHADGMDTFFAINQTAPFYLRAGSKEICYDYDASKPDDTRYIGIKRGTLDKYAERIVFAEGDYELFPGVYLIPHKTAGLEKIGEKAHMYVQRDGQFVPDDYAHEQSLVFESEKGLVIFNSCSHGGADNIIREIETTFPDKKMYAIFGGFHLYKSSEAEVRALARRIRETGIEKVVTGHCTGDEAYQILKEELGDCLEQIYTGMIFEI